MVDTVDGLNAVVTIEFFQVKPPKITVEGESPPGLGKFERQLTNIYRALQMARSRARKEKRDNNG